MTAVQEASARLMSSSSGGGQSEAAPSDPWEQASAPAKVAKRLIEGVFQRQAPAERIPLLTNVMHWAYGTGWGSVYGLIAGSLPRGRALRHGLAFGTGVWIMSYVQLVPMGLYELPWKYSPQDLGLEFGYHLAYGAGVGVTFAAVS